VKEKKQGRNIAYTKENGERKVMVSTHEERTTFSPFKTKSLTYSITLAQKYIIILE
jgi:hypothetical protein